jgi:sugar phosphate isomerase/epimerase
MRYAVQGVTPDSHTDLRDTHLERIAAMGYDGVTFHFSALTTPGADPKDVSPADRDRLRQMVERHGLEFAYCWGYWAPLVAHDAADHKRAIELLAGAIRLAYDVGSRFVVAGPGSNDDRSGWYPHPDNWTEHSLERLCTAVSSVAALAEELDVTVSLKGHVLSTLDTPATLARAVELVDSDHVVGGIDPVNQMSLADAFRPRRLIDELLDRLGHSARIAHAKDYRLDPAMVISLPEVPFGLGWLDVPYYLEHVAAKMTDPWFIVEHVADAEQEAAATRLRRSRTDAST